jgi:RimJ/RimL family protein N-acetyltransferase
MTTKNIPIIETERLVLREFVVSDATFVIELLNCDTWLQFIGNRGITTLQDGEIYIKEKFISSYQKNGYGFYLVALKNADLSYTSIGMCGLVKRPALENIDIGFAFLPNYEKKGYAFEAAFATLQYAKTALQLGDIVAITTADNINSIHLLQKLGLEFKKIVDIAADDRNLLLFG